MVAPAGIEPTTRGLGNRCSIQLSYGANLMFTAVEVEAVYWNPGTATRAGYDLIENASAKVNLDINEIPWYYSRSYAVGLLESVLGRPTLSRE